MPLGKAARLAEFYDRFRSAQPCANASDALQQLCTILNAVEDEFSGAANQPDNHRSDGRMYPPQGDAAREVDGRSELTRYRSRAHNTYISSDGAVLIMTIGNEVLFSKPGVSGLEIKL